LSPSDCGRDCAIGEIQRGVSQRGAAVLGHNGWTVSRLHQYPFPGWLVLAPDRHVTGFGQLGRQDAAEFADLLGRLDRTIRAELDPVKVYLLALGDRMPHWHLLLAPVSAAAAELGVVGAEVLQRYPEPPDPDRAEQVAARIAAIAFGVPPLAPP
jgi:diadenosine tetraphosphate (Ap4A) HIT family hydrolase